MEMGSDSASGGVVLLYNVHSIAHSAQSLSYCCHHMGMTSACMESGLSVGLWEGAGD